MGSVTSGPGEGPLCQRILVSLESLLKILDAYFFKM